MNTEALSKSELKIRLKNIKNDKTEFMKYKGPDCIFPTYEIYNIGRCEWCGKSLTSLFSRHYYQALSNKVKIITDLGYDAKIELVCGNCLSGVNLSTNLLEKLFAKKKNISENAEYFIFSIKLKEEDKYYLTTSNDINDYNAVLSFLQNKSIWFGLNGESYVLREELGRVKRMLGL